MQQPTNQSTVGAPSPKSLANFKAAKSHRVNTGKRLIEFKFWTGRFYVVPVHISETCTMMFDGFVHWRRVYWLTFGVSIIRPLK